MSTEVPEAPYGGGWPDQAEGNVRLLLDDGDPGQYILAPDIDGFHPAHEPLTAAATGGLRELEARKQRRARPLDLGFFLRTALTSSNVVYSSRPADALPQIVHFSSNPDWQKGDIR